MNPYERLELARHVLHLQYDMDIGGYTTDAAIAAAEREFRDAERAVRSYKRDELLRFIAKHHVVMPKLVQRCYGAPHS